MADVVARDLRVPAAGRQLTLQKFARRKSTIAFLMALPLIMIVACLVVYPAFYSIHLATLNKSMQHFVGFGNFEFLFKRNTFWMVVEQSMLFAVTAVIFKAVVGFIVAHFVHNLPAQGPAQMARHAADPVGHPAGDEHARLAVAVRPVLQRLQLGLRPSRHPAGRLARQSLLGALLRDPRQCLGRLAVLHDHVSRGAQIGARAIARGGGDRRRQLACRRSGTSTFR